MQGPPGNGPSDFGVFRNVFRYEKFAKIYEKTRFLKIVGNENESCKHYAKEVLHAKISPMFAVYRQGSLERSRPMDDRVVRMVNAQRS